MQPIPDHNTLLSELRDFDMLCCGGPALSAESILIRTATAGVRYALRTDVSVHTCLFRRKNGIPTAVGMTGRQVLCIDGTFKRGLVEEPLSNYYGRKSFLVALRRTAEISWEPDKVAALHQHVDTLVEKGARYPFEELPEFVFGQKFDHPELDYCSEFVRRVTAPYVYYPPRFTSMCSPWQMQCVGSWATFMRMHK